MIADRKEFEHSLKSVAKMYGIRDKIAADTNGDPGTREDEIISVVMMIKKIEREIAAYLRTRSFTDEEYPEIEQAMARYAAQQHDEAIGQESKAPVAV